MKSLFAAAALACALVTPAFAADEAALAPVHQFANGMNKNDIKSAIAAFATSHTLTDEFTPFYWQGTDAISAWLKDFGAFAQKNGITEPTLKLVKRKAFNQDGDKAYYVASAVFAYKEGGKAVAEHGLVTFGLAKESAGWRITSFTWALDH